MLAACSVQAAWATEIVHYDNMPVTIELHKGEERTLKFGDHVQVGITKGQQVKKLFRAQSAQGAVHFLPYSEFDKQRVQIKRMTDGRVILLDLVSTTAPNNKPLEEVKIILDFENTVEDPEVTTSSDSTMDIPVVTPVDLTRYVSQKLYGPTRLHRDLPGISETELGVKGAIKIFRGENKYKTVSTPIVAYQSGNYYIAGIHIKNTAEHPVRLDYFDLNLQFSHATFQHHTLNENGTPGDSTTLYLVSEKPLKETLYPWTYYKDLEAEQLANKDSKKQRKDK